MQQFYYGLPKISHGQASIHGPMDGTENQNTSKLKNDRD
jgi:hypothetical protein